MPLTGDLVYEAGFNANGIAARGGWLVLVQSNTGLLFRVNPRTGVTRQIDTGGYLVTTGDGLEFRGRTLYVVRNQINTVAVLQVGHGLRKAKLVGEITAERASCPCRRPRPRAWVRLWVVNARFGTPPTPDTQYWITRLPLRP